METKYIFVTGGVVSGLDRGIVAASLGGLLIMRVSACGGDSYGDKRPQLQEEGKRELRYGRELSEHVSYQHNKMSLPFSTGTQTCVGSAYLFLS